MQISAHADVLFYTQYIERRINMGYFSQHAVALLYKNEDPESYRNAEYSRRNTLEYYLETLSAKLERIEAACPDDPLNQFYDRFYYARSSRRYFENPQTVQELLCAISEVKELIYELDCEEILSREKKAQIAELEQLSQVSDGQILMVSYWDYAAMFREAAIYKKILSVISK